MISVVNGVAAAAGCQFIASSDIVVATPQSKYEYYGFELLEAQLLFNYGVTHRQRND